MNNTQELYEEYKKKMRRIADVRNASALMQWDQETHMPAKGASIRGEQISTLSEISHQLFSDDALGILLNQLLEKEDLDLSKRRNVERTFEDYTKSKKYTSAFVRSLSEQVNKTFHSWLEARKLNSFSFYEKDLGALVDLKKEEAQIIGYTDHPYDALLDEYEKGCTVQLLDKTFNDVLPALQNLYNRIIEKNEVDDSFLSKTFPKDEQWKWGMYLIEKLNYDLQAGRQDISEHPFSISFNPQDVRITTRISEKDFGNMTWSCIHEVGHALYEQGLPVEEYGLPLGEACSYSIHESQSRLWENCVGRSKLFWDHYYNDLHRYFPEQLSSVTVEDFYKAINKVQPSLIRTEADEISYHFHVYIRYELEKKLIEGSLSSSEIPEYWNEQYKKYLKLNVPDDKRGCLQDVHWSHGSFGYFPTYSLGSFYAAQFYDSAKKDIIGLEESISKGDTSTLLEWLRRKIHSNGRFYRSEELCKQITGEGLNVSSFINYLLAKYSSIYNLDK